MDEFLAAPPAESAAPEEDPFGLSAAPVVDAGGFEPPEPLAPPADGGADAFAGGMDAFAAPGGEMVGEMGSEMGGMGGMDSFAADPLPMPEAEPLPTFGEMPEAVPEPAVAGLGDEFAEPAALGPLAKWRIEQQEKVAAKAAAAEEALAERVQEAQAALAQFYAERTEIISKRAAQNREEEAAYVEDRDATMIADSWESVYKLIDVKEQKEEPAKDTSRMKQVLLKLKHT